MTKRKSKQKAFYHINATLAIWFNNMIDERMRLLYHIAFIIFYKSSPKQNLHWTISSEVSKMTSLAKIGFWFINNIGRKNIITKCYKNVVSGITKGWNIKYTTQNGILKCANHLSVWQYPAYCHKIQTIDFSDYFNI